MFGERFLFQDAECCHQRNCQTKYVTFRGAKIASPALGYSHFRGSLIFLSPVEGVLADDSICHRS
jgi:hypothetical protein